MANCAILSSRAIVAVNGPGARDFLQGLITNDIASCGPGRGIYAALLTPQGKILFDFFIAQKDEQYLLDCGATAATDLVRRLNFYRLRAKVQISQSSELSVAVVWGEPLSLQSNNIIQFADPRLPSLGMRLIGPPQQLTAAVASIPRGDYECFRISLGIADSADLPADQIFALDAALEELHGVSFSKGCYVGQEVTARMKHRATARRRFYIVEGKPQPAPGTVIRADGRELGRMATGTKSRGVALVRLDRLAEAEAANARIEADTIPVVLRKPDWLHV
jgi:folate-binding protein YgfZ